MGPNYTVLSLSALHKGFRPFAAYHAASRYISLIRTFFCCCGATLRCVQLFRTGNGFCLFGANRAVLSCFGSLLPYFQLFCTWKRFSPVFFFLVLNYAPFGSITRKGFFAWLPLNLAGPTFITPKEVFCLFVASYIHFSFISLKTFVLLLAGEFRYFF